MAGYFRHVVGANSRPTQRMRYVPKNNDMEDVDRALKGRHRSKIRKSRIRKTGIEEPEPPRMEDYGSRGEFVKAYMGYVGEYANYVYQKYKDPLIAIMVASTLIGPVVASSSTAKAQTSKTITDPCSENFKDGGSYHFKIRGEAGDWFEKDPDKEDNMFAIHKKCRDDDRGDSKLMRFEFWKNNANNYRKARELVDACPEKNGKEGYACKYSSPSKEIEFDAVNTEHDQRPDGKYNSSFNAIGNIDGDFKEEGPDEIDPKIVGGTGAASMFAALAAALLYRRKKKGKPIEVEDIEYMDEHGNPD